MIQLILFVVACFAWQAVKDALRKKSPRPANMKIKAKCGCVILPHDPHAKKARVAEPCAAHRIITTAVLKGNDHEWRRYSSHVGPLLRCLR